MKKLILLLAFFTAISCSKEDDEPTEDNAQYFTVTIKERCSDTATQTYCVPEDIYRYIEKRGGEQCELITVPTIDNESHSGVFWSMNKSETPLSCQ